MVPRPNGNLVGQKDGSNSTKYFSLDGKGNVTALVDSTGSVVNSYKYDPYGKDQGSTLGTSSMFTWKSGLDTSKGLVKFGARYYDPTTSRWMSQDPVPNGNRYTYGAANPIDHTDPSGRIDLGLFDTDDLEDVPVIGKYAAAF